MSWLINQAALLPDSFILIGGAALTAGVAIALAWLARRFWFAPRATALETHAKLADLVHGGLLAFAVFTLALALSDVRANFTRADDSALREASFAARLDRELQAIGSPDADAARTRLKAYVAAVVDDEWKTLGLHEPQQSPAADRTLTALVADIRRLAAASPDWAPSLRSLIDRMEESRQSRLESATKGVPTIFWWMIVVFLVGAMAMNGRNPIDLEGASLIVLHMAAIGLVLALIIAMDAPFRGQTSISPAPLAKAVGLVR